MDPAAAEANHREAIAIAQQQSAKLWELRAATSLTLLHNRFSFSHGAAMPGVIGAAGQQRPTSACSGEIARVSPLSNNRLRAELDDGVPGTIDR
jgi:hypothetical protein